MSSIESPLPDAQTTSNDDSGGATADQVSTDASPSVESAEEPSVDVIFEILKNERRRRVINYLREHEGQAELGTIAEYVAALENNKDEAAITYAERKRVYVGLYQCHLPKMDDMGVVDFNRARGRIELTEQTEHLLPYLDGPADDRPWHRYYGGVVLAGFGAYLATVLAGASASMTAAISLVALCAFAVCTVAHFLATR